MTTIEVIHTFEIGSAETLFLAEWLLTSKASSKSLIQIIKEIKSLKEQIKLISFFIVFLVSGPER